MGVKTKNEYVKSPLNYVGGKHKLLPQIIPHFPDNIGTFVDLFAGGCNVSANVNANFIYINDTQEEVMGFIQYLYGRELDDLIEELDGIIEEYSLSKHNKEGYLKLREDYNKGTRGYLEFYALISHAFNYQIRFNKKGEFNMPFGKDRSSFNPRLRENFIEFVESLHDRRIYIQNSDFLEFDFSSLGDGDLIYCDPPYLITTAAYNENGGWNEEKERALYRKLDELDEQGVKFCLSNVTEAKGRHNTILTEWAQKYNLIELNHSYANANYQRKDRDSKTVEVIVTNYAQEDEGSTT